MTWVAAYIATACLLTFGAVALLQRAAPQEPETAHSGKKTAKV